MKRYLDGLAVLLTSAWVGGMWLAGYVAAPVIFQSLSDKTLAGVLAGKLFGVTAYIGIVCAVYLLLYFHSVYSRQGLRHNPFWLIVVMLLLTLLGQFGMQPMMAELKTQASPLYVMDSPYADHFRLWHGAASIVYLLQSMLGAVLLLKLHGVRG